MRYYIPRPAKTFEKTLKEEGRSPSFAVPFWVCIALIIILMFFVISLR